MNDSNPSDVTQDLRRNPVQKDEGPPARTPERIGRYRIEKALGKGGFGLVYLAHDERLDRAVAIKVPHAKLIAKPGDVEAYLAEARTVASLDHPHIVPVFDVGAAEDCPCYVVSKYIEGADLAAKLKERRFNYLDAAELAATLAEALHYAHKQGIVHRDIKPSNILIDRSGAPHLADFGLALREESFGTGPECAGTPSYMSPEQARGEGHRVDGRSDVFSLGVVFYELLVGRRPFRGASPSEALEQIVRCEPRPLRQYDDRIPRELERICHTAMAKRAADRYTTAKDVAEDLRSFLAEQTAMRGEPSAGGATSPVSETANARRVSITAHLPGAASSLLESEASDSQPVKIVPKGLRSFDAHDADFFLELLPGARDRAGLPDSLRFWKTRIEERDEDDTFAVGLIYGPSGCGKSSLVKAGLLPRLSEDVIPVYVESTPDDTETRLLHALRKRCAALEDDLSLKVSLAALRRGQGLPVGKKALIVLDQFEQWLHAKQEDENSELVQALRQCDGVRVQCIVMVRDDFWMAATRFMRELEVRLLEGRNSAAVDLFPVRHAEKVLAAFGRAFGALPDDVDANKEQISFLAQSVAGLAEEGRVVCVRLALYAEMMKGKPWTPAALKGVGGTMGVGVSFLEETFSASTSPPEHRYHQKAARAVLKALLPDSGTDIKGAMRSYAELLEASGYGNRPKDFDDLIRILDSEIRLITPTDPEGIDKEVESSEQQEPRTRGRLNADSLRNSHVSHRFFQLTHDYLVPSLRDWLTSKQKETRKGRAELKLFDSSATWNAKPESRFLPSWWEHLTIRLLTDRRKWTAPQRKMMAKAGRVHGIRTSLGASLIVGTILGGIAVRSAVVEQQRQTQVQIQEKENSTRAEELVASLLKADIAQVPSIVSDLKAYRVWADPLLRTRVSEVEDGSAEKLHLVLALLSDDDAQLEYLRDQLLVCSLSQFPVLRTAMLPHKDKLTDALWQVATDEQREAATRFQAAAALAEYAPDDPRWAGRTASFVAEHLTALNVAGDLGQWRELLQPSRGVLTAPLIGIHADRSRGDMQRGAAALVLAEYLRDQPHKLADVILAADELAEFAPLIAVLRPHAAEAAKRFRAEMGAALPDSLALTNDHLSDADQRQRDGHWRRQSLAAAALVQLGYGDEVWPLLKFGPDPSLRSFVIHHLGSLGTDPQILAARLQSEPDVSVRQALIQSLGAVNAGQLSPPDRSRIVGQLKTLHAEDVDPGVHSSSAWALRQWDEPLPELPPGEPVRTPEQRDRIAGQRHVAADLKRQLQDLEADTSARQARWERELQSRSLAEPVSEGLLLHYPLDEAEGNATASAVPGRAAGELIGEPPPVREPGILGHCLKFSDGGGQLRLGQEFSPDRGDAFSWGCWIRRDAAAHTGYLLSNLGGRGIGFSVSGDALRMELRHAWPDNQILVHSDSVLRPDAWQHVFVTVDQDANVAFFVDGSPAPSRVVENTLSDSIAGNAPLTAGKFANYSFRGRIDEVRIYDRALEEKEVLALYESALAQVARVLPDDRSSEQTEFLAARFRSQDRELNVTQEKLRLAEMSLRQSSWDGVRRWYVNSQGQTMVILFPTPDSEMASNGRSVAINSHEVSLAEFLRFRPTHTVDRSSSPTDDCPAHRVSWYEAAEYCNWISRQDGIPEDQWIYLPNDDGEYAAGLRIKANASDLSGYRLPLEREWEFACRAGTAGSYSFGEPVPLLRHYAWYAGNSSGQIHPVESLLPNAFGMFGMHGNVWEWAFEPVGANPAIPDEGRLLLGGGFGFQPAWLRSTGRNYNAASIRGMDIGFRMVRILPIGE